MITKILTYYTERLEEFLAHRHHQPEGLAMLGAIGTVGEEPHNKLVVSLVGLEKEPSGNGMHMQRNSSGYVGTAAPLLLNIHIMMAAVYEGQRYAESLSILSDTLAYIQSMPRFEVNGYCYTMEIVTTSTMDLHNIWATMGGQYYPSVICKLSRVVIDSSNSI